MRTDRPKIPSDRKNEIEKFIHGKREKPSSIFSEAEMRIEKLEKRVAQLREEVELLKQRLP